MDLQKAYADDEEFQLTPAQAARLMAQQAAELEDTDTPQPAAVPSPLPSQQTPLVRLALERQPSQNAPAAAVAAALQTSASVPAAAQETSLTPAAAAALLPAASAPLTEPPHAAPATSAAKAGRTQPNADVAQAGSALSGQLRQTPHSSVKRPPQELYSAASGSAVPAANAAPSTVAAANGASADGGGGGGGDSRGAAPSAAMSGGQSQKSGAKVWLTPAALASPQRSSGKMIYACKPKTLCGSKSCLCQQYHYFFRQQGCLPPAPHLPLPPSFSSPAR